jgi:arsenite transporter
MIMGAIAAGLSLSVAGEISRVAGRLVLPFLLVMLTLLFLQIPLRDLTAAFRQKTAAGLNISVNFLWNPVFAWLLGWFFLYDHPELRTGLLLLMVTPCTDWYLIFTSMAKGNIALSTSLLPWNLVLQLILLPVYLLLLAGTVIPVDLLLLLESILLVLLLPLGLAALIRGAVIRRKGEAWFRSALIPRLNPFQMIFRPLPLPPCLRPKGRCCCSISMPCGSS